MTENIIAFIGAFLKHVVGVLLLCWRRMLRAGLVAFGIGVVLALLVAVISTGQAFPGTLALVAALIFGAALGYGVALTVLVEEFVLGIIDLIHLLEGDAEKVAHISEALAEREIGEVGKGLGHLLGLPLGGSRRVTPAATTPAKPPVPTLPTLPRYPTAPARAAAPNAASGLAQAAVAAGASALVARAGAAPARAATPAQPPAPAMTPAAQPLEPEAPEPPAGEPVPADRLPRLTWTYEHEAIKPAQVAAAASASKPATEPPETLAELAGASAGAALVADAGLAAAERATSAEDPAAEPVAAPAAAATRPDAYSPITPEAPVEDAPPLEDERLAAPAPFTFADDEASADNGPLAPALQAEEAPAEPGSSEATVAAQAPAVEPVVTPTFYADEATVEPSAVETPAAEPVVAEPAATESAPLDPAMLTPAPVTTPLEESQEPPSAEEPAPVEAPAPSATEVEAPASAEEPAAETSASLAEPAAESVEAAAPGVEPAEPAAEAAPPARSAFSRITRPVEDLGTALNTLSRTGAMSGPRASAPESGLWERLSQALIDRAGAPSNPFAAPQSPRAGDSAATGDSAGSEPDGTQQG